MTLAKDNVPSKSIAELLDEGLIHSYPTKNVISQLKSCFNKAKNQDVLIGYKLVDDEQDKLSDRELFGIQFAFKQKMDLKDFQNKYLNRDLSLLGWYIGNVSHREVELSDGVLDTVFFYFEPRYPLESDKVEKFSKNLIEKHRFFYHMTFAKFESSISKNGLVPHSSDRKDFFYPERIYLFTESDFAKMFANYHLFDKEGVAHRRKIELRLDRKTKKIANLDFQKKDEDILIYKIDLQALLRSGKEVALYHDNRFTEPDADTISAVFTYNTIPSKYLELLGRIRTKIIYAYNRHP